MGAYPITCSGITSANYAVTYVPGTLTVTPAALTIAANNATKAYGAPLPAFTATYTGFVNGDTPASLTGALACTTTATVASPAGTYPINCSGQTSANYTIIYTPGTLTVTAVPLTLSANNATKAYGAPLPAFTATYSGFVNGDTAASLTGALGLHHDGHRCQPGGNLPDQLLGSDFRQLHHHLRTGHVDGHCCSVDALGQQCDQGVRCAAPGVHGHGHWLRERGLRGVAGWDAVLHHNRNRDESGGSISDQLLGSDFPELHDHLHSGHANCDSRGAGDRCPQRNPHLGFANPVFTPTATGLVTPPDTLASLGVRLHPRLQPQPVPSGTTRSLVRV